jgi:hypothetical protein
LRAAIACESARVDSRHEKPLFGSVVNVFVRQARLSRRSFALKKLHDTDKSII